MNKAQVYSMSAQQIEANDKVAKDFRPIINKLLADMTVKLVREVGLPEPVAVAGVSTALIEHVLRLHLAVSGILIKKQMLADIEESVHEIQRSLSVEVYDLTKRIKDDMAGMN